MSGMIYENSTLYECEFGFGECAIGRVMNEAVPFSFGFNLENENVSVMI